MLLGRAEKRALAWAAKILMPWDALRAVLGRACSVQEVAGEFQVTPAFVRATLELPAWREGLGQRERELA